MKVAMKWALVLVVGGLAAGAPPLAGRSLLDVLIERLYEEIQRDQKNGDVYEQMQGDQPAVTTDRPPGNTISDEEVLRRMRERGQEADGDHLRIKKTQLDQIKQRVYNYLRPNMTSSTNITSPFDYFMAATSATVSDDLITEKIRSYYPTCTPPSDPPPPDGDQPDLMRLHFEFEERAAPAAAVAAATLRLYRLANATLGGGECADGEEERLLRVSVYWYAAGKRARRARRRLADSRVVAAARPWVELSVRPAARQWARGRSVGLAVQVEDEEGAVLSAETYFRGPDCMVGESTPKPIPKIVMDAVRQPGGTDFAALLSDTVRKSSLLSGALNASALPPSIDVCTLEAPADYAGSMERAAACGARAAAPRPAPATEPQRHWRHHRRDDVRALMENKQIVMKRDDFLTHLTNR